MDTKQDIKHKNRINRIKKKINNQNNVEVEDESEEQHIVIPKSSVKKSIKKSSIKKEDKKVQTPQKANTDQNVSVFQELEEEEFIPKKRKRLIRCESDDDDQQVTKKIKVESPK